ncbi:hypothetical protein OGV71_12055 [Citrobacter sp. Cf088]|uniref:hypothetical protein n=1 Tax=Citrobacter sp. Cf088 TaxID=2985055 RepID=UPI0025777000|nr:hypothetical protein [Citrobacter sp. Cf088]MDM3222457.1 hypothetical protein [Citrobacter sp. Cf088]
MTTNNHPANGPVSLERLHQISEILSKAAAQSDGGNLGYAMADAVKVIDVAIAEFDAEPVTVNDYMAYAFHHAISDSSIGVDEVEEIKTGLLAAFANATTSLSTVVPDEMTIRDACKFVQDMRIFDDVSVIVMRTWNSCRAAMLQAGNSPVTPDGLALVPKRLTAENGAKSVLSGEFSETKFINCPECFGDDDCETCDGSGRIEITVPVTWTTIKAIWDKGVELFAAG